MLRYGRKEVLGAAIVQEENALPQSPQRRRAELISTRSALPDVVGQSGAHVMNFNITEQVGRCVAQARCDTRSRRGKRRRVAGRAANGTEQAAAVADGGGPTRHSGGRSGLGCHAHEDGKLHHVTRRAEIGGIEVGVVFRRAVDAAVGRQSTSRLVFAGQRALRGEGLIADALFHVVCLTGKDQQRLVLRLPAKAADGAVIAVVIERTAGAEGTSIGGRIGQQRCIVNVLHQARAKGRRRDAEDHVVGGHCLGKAGLRDIAGASVSAAGNGEEVFHSAVGSVRVGVAKLVKEEWETRFSYGTRRSDERRDSIPCAISRGVSHLRVGCGGCAANRRLSMAKGAASGVEARSKSSTGFDGAGNRIYFVE